MKIILTKSEYITLLKATFHKIGKPNLDFENLRNLGSLFGTNTFPSDDLKDHVENQSLKSELLKNKDVVRYLCLQSQKGKGWQEWCIAHNRKYNSDQFFPNNSTASIENYKHLLTLECLESKTHLECIFKTFNIKRYYDYYNDFKKVSYAENKNLNTKYITAITSYLGFQNFKDFKNSSLFTEFAQNNEGQPNQNKSSNTAPEFTKYTGYYYDYLKNNVFSFSLEVDFMAKKTQAVMSLKNPNAKLVGLHQDHDDLEYEGNAYFLNHKMHIILWYLKTDHGAKEKIKIILNSGREKFEDAKVLKGLILASNSINNSPISIEAIFKREDFEYTDAENLRMQRYLMLKRNNILVRNKSFDFKKLSAKNLVVDQLSNLQGAWHSIRYDKNWNLVHSIIHVEKNYRVTCYTNTTQTIAIQNCYFEPSEKSNFVLYISCKEDNCVISQIAIKLPNRNSDIIKGVMILHPINDESDFLPIMRSIVLGNVDKEIQLSADGNFNKNLNAIADFLTQFNDPEMGTNNSYRNKVRKLVSLLKEINSANKVNV